MTMNRLWPFMEPGGRWVWRDVLMEARGETTPPPSLELGAPSLALFTDLGGVADYRHLPRGRHYQPAEWGYFRQRDGKMGTHKKNTAYRARNRGIARAGKAVDQILLHCTGVAMGAPRFLGVPAHVGVAEDGTIVLLHDTLAYMPHGHGANRRAIGVEISGPPNGQSPQALESARAVVSWLAAGIRARGLSPSIAAHRQYHTSRKRDPGALIWSQVAEPALASGEVTCDPGARGGLPLGSNCEWP